MECRLLQRQWATAKGLVDKTAIQRQIDVTDKRIDHAVYERYGLMYEAIKVTEDFPRLTSCYVLWCPTEFDMYRQIQLLDVVALMVDLPDRSLLKGQVGTVVEALGQDVYEIEFSDDQGKTYASLALKADQLLILHHRPVQAAWTTGLADILACVVKTAHLAKKVTGGALGWSK